MQKPMKAALLHLGSNMWAKKGQEGYHDVLDCDKDIWVKITNEMARLDYNAILIDMGEGVQLKSHPELSVEGSWTQEEFRAELKRLKEMGLTPYPKFNFSAGHSAWLQEYNYMVGSPEYDKVCKDVIEEVIDLFDTPEFFHLGLEEEDEIMQKHYTVSVMRTPKKKMRDALYLMDVCRSKGVRPWIWADEWTVRDLGGEEEFCKNVGRDVLMSNYQYCKITERELAEGRENAWYKFYVKLGEWGYEQVPTESVWGWHLNSKEAIRYCEARAKGVVGYLMAPWKHTNQDAYYSLMSDIHNFHYAWEDEMK